MFYSQGHVLWIEPCSLAQTKQCWDKISAQLSKIVDLSVSDEETNKKREDIERERRQKMVNKSIEEEDNYEVRKTSERTLTATQTSENLHLSDMYTSIASNTMTTLNSNSRSQENEQQNDEQHTSSHLEVIQNAAESYNLSPKRDTKRQSSISDQLLQIHTAKSSGIDVDVDTIYIPDNDDEDDSDENDIVDVDNTDTDYDDEDDDDNELPALGHALSDDKKNQKQLQQHVHRMYFSECVYSIQTKTDVFMLQCQVQRTKLRQNHAHQCINWTQRKRKRLRKIVQQSQRLLFPQKTWSSLLRRRKRFDCILTTSPLMMSLCLIFHKRIICHFIMHCN